MSNLSLQKYDFLIQLSRLYYLKNMTHQQIADKYGLSRVKVTRLLKEAVLENIIEFKIAEPISNSVDLQEQLENKFGVKRAIVTPTGQNDVETRDILGKYTGMWLSDNLFDGINIGLGWGRTLNAMVPHITNDNKKNIRVVSMTGGLAANSNQPNPYDVTSAIASKINADARYLLAPAVVKDKKIKQLLTEESHVLEILKLWKQLDLCVMSIGSLSAKTGIFYTFPEPELEVKKTKEMGAVGDLLAQPFDINGKVLRMDFAERTISINFEDLKKVPTVVGVAGGTDKIKSIYGALRSGYLTVIVTDEKTALQVLDS